MLLLGRITTVVWCLVTSLSVKAFVSPSILSQRDERKQTLSSPFRKTRSTGMVAGGAQAYGEEMYDGKCSPFRGCVLLVNRLICFRDDKWICSCSCRKNSTPFCSSLIICFCACVLMNDDVTLPLSHVLTGVRIGPPPDLPSLLLHNRIVYVGMPLVPAVTELIIAELLYLNYEDNEKPITMYINSSGTTTPDGRSVGFETEAFAIADVMKYVRPPVCTVAVGQAFGKSQN